MPVVIGDLDVEVEASTPAASGDAPPASGGTALTASHLDDLARQLAARRERVRAD